MGPTPGRRKAVFVLNKQYSIYYPWGVNTVHYLSLAATKKQ
jgi:hypothetical protein